MSESVGSCVQISLSTGVVVPVSYSFHASAGPALILGHGLGSTNPKLKDHVKDKWISLAADAAKEEVNVISYTARGHGTTTGWEGTAESNPSQFTWIELAKDMGAVAAHFSAEKYIAGGSSMGSATSLYAAIAQPERVVGLILIRPPTAWEVRKARRKNLLRSADRLKAELAISEEGNAPYDHVLRGTAYSDLPALESEDYRRIQHIPTLILTIEDDAAHPVATAESLHALLPSSTLHVAPDIKTAAAEWPALVENFVRSVVSSSV